MSHGVSSPLSSITQPLDRTFRKRRNFSPSGSLPVMSAPAPATPSQCPLTAHLREICNYDSSLIDFKIPNHTWLAFQRGPRSGLPILFGVVKRLFGQPGRTPANHRPAVSPYQKHKASSPCLKVHRPKVPYLRPFCRRNATSFTGLPPNGPTAAST